MTKYHIRFVLNSYIKELDSRGCFFERNPDKPLNHILWMCHENLKHIDENKSDRKIGAWLGFVQGVLFSEKIFTIPELRDHNRDIESATKSLQKEE